MSDSLPPAMLALRKDIEEIDRALITTIARRVEAARAVGRAKREHDLAILDPAREAAVVRRAVEMARDAKLNEEEVREIFWHVIGMCRRAQLEGHAEN